MTIRHIVGAEPVDDIYQINTQHRTLRLYYDGQPDTAVFLGNSDVQITLKEPGAILAVDAASQQLKRLEPVRPR